MTIWNIKVHIIIRHNNILRFDRGQSQIRWGSDIIWYSEYA